MPVPLKRAWIMLPGQAKRTAAALVVSKRPTKRTVAGVGGASSGGATDPADATDGGMGGALPEGTCAVGGSWRVQPITRATATNDLRTRDFTTEA